MSARRKTCGKSVNHVCHSRCQHVRKYGSSLTLAHFHPSSKNGKELCWLSKIYVYDFYCCYDDNYDDDENTQDSGLA